MMDILFVRQIGRDSRRAHRVEETLGTLDSLVQSGKILYPAASNWAAWQIADALGISEQKLGEVSGFAADL